LFYTRPLLRHASALTKPTLPWRQDRQNRVATSGQILLQSFGAGLIAPKRETGVSASCI